MITKNTTTLAFASVLLAAFVGGGLGVFTKIGIREIPLFSFIFLRFFLATLFLLPFALKEKLPQKKELLKTVRLSLLSTINVTFAALGLKFTTATIGQLLYTCVPILAAILSYYFLKEKINSRKIVGILTGFIGVLVIILLPVLDKGTTLQGDIYGNLITLIAVFSFSFYSVFSKKYQKDFQISPILMTLIFSITTSIVLAPLVLMDYLHDPTWIIHLSTHSYFSTVYVALFGGALYYLLYQYAIKHGTATIASMTLFLQPVATFIWAAILLGETLTAGILIGGMLTLYGAYLVVLKK